MEEVPKFIKEFSKTESQEDRQKTAQAIRDKRAEYFAEKEDIEKKKLNTEREFHEREQILNERLDVINNLKNEIEELSSSGLEKILSYFKIKKLKADLVLGEKSYEELKEQYNLKISEIKLNPPKKDEELSQPLRQAEEMVNNFYRQQEKKWSDSEYSKEDIQKYFTEENLSSLNIQEYTLLLKRFPSEMVTHVTRQGIRDHIGHSFHTEGEGAYFDGFMKIVKDGRLHSALSISLIENEKKEAIEKFLRLDFFKDKKEAIDYLNIITNVKEQNQAGSYIDRTAIHFATEEVADGYYGSEKGNEIFFTFPSAHIASQYNFRGQLNKSGGGYWNDQWVWANEDKGININTGLVFIPEETMVDKETGSRYKLDENKNPIENIEYIKLFKELFNSKNFESLAKEIMEISGHVSFGLSSKEDKELLKKLEPYRIKLKNEFGINDPRLQNACFDYGYLLRLISYKEREANETDLEEQIKLAMQEYGILYKETDKPISSKDFWENYFKNNPLNKPSKIIYYKGSDPTKAFREWKINQGLNKRTEDEDMGFSERSIKENGDELKVANGLDRFRSLALGVIDDYYQK